MSTEEARRVADAVLYEGYLLYPYRASATKNQMRWQFGVLAPPSMAADWAEASSSRTQCLLEADRGAEVTVLLRFLHLRSRLQGERPAWDEGVERQVRAELRLDGERSEVVLPVSFGPSRQNEGGATWVTAPLELRLTVCSEQLPGPYGVRRVTLGVDNTSDWSGPAGSRDDVVRRSLVGAHAILAVDQGHFLSMLDPPEWARPAVAQCDNVGTFPVLVGETESPRVVLSSPIILYDFPTVAPESPGDLFDATEIDEILTLRTLALTDAEKAEARATDPRAASVIDRVDDIPAEVMNRLHGAIRSLEPVGSPSDDGTDVPWWDPGADDSVSPETDVVWVSGTKVGRGSRVLLRPGPRRADAQDMFLRDREAVVEAVLTDVDDHRHLAVTVAGDPASDLHRWHGRFLYFDPDEVEPVGEESAGSNAGASDRARERSR